MYSLRSTISSWTSMEAFAIWSEICISTEVIHESVTKFLPQLRLSTHFSDFIILHYNHSTPTQQTWHPVNPDPLAKKSEVWEVPSFWRPLSPHPVQLIKLWRWAEGSVGVEVGMGLGMNQLLLSFLHLALLKHRRLWKKAFDRVEFMEASCRLVTEPHYNPQHTLESDVSIFSLVGCTFGWSSNDKLMRELGLWLCRVNLFVRFGYDATCVTLLACVSHRGWIVFCNSIPFVLNT